MSRSTEYLLDEIDWKILELLQENARVPYAELGRRVGLSTPAASERVRHLEDAGIILAYRAQVDPAKVGYPVLAYIRINVAGEKLAKFVTVVEKCPEALECHRVTGAESFIVKVAVSDIQHLQSVIDSLMPYVATTTSMILSSPLTWGTVKQRPKSAGESSLPVGEK